jgi:hypothetical protein
MNDTTAVIEPEVKRFYPLVPLMNRDETRVAKAIDDLIRGLRPGFFTTSRRNWIIESDACGGDLFKEATCLATEVPLVVKQWDFVDDTDRRMSIIAREVRYNEVLVYRNSFNQQVTDYHPGPWEHMLVP